MGRLLEWYLLAWLTGSPLGAAVLLVALWWLADRFTFRLLPSPVRLLARRRRIGQLRRTLAANPHDRRARFELAELLLETRRPREAVDVLRPNLEAGDDDVHTAFTMGAALARSGLADQAERVLAAARERDPDFRMGEIELEVGRLRVARGDFAGARAPLERLVAARPGTVEGRYLLARALEGAGDDAGARRVREEAWREYASMPRFHRRLDRPFAWRIRPWRPAAVAIAVAAACLLAAWLLGARGGPGGGAGRRSDAAWRDGR
jgi:tetratricopeptide (TPR) repeat protein